MAETYISIEKIRSLAEVGTIDELKGSTDMNEIFAACAIASKKYLGLIPYDEQLTAAAELTKGRITEMKRARARRFAPHLPQAIWRKTVTMSEYSPSTIILQSVTASG